MILKYLEALFLIMLLIAAIVQANLSAIPRLVILGQNGEDKSKIANLLLGSSLSSDNLLTKTEKLK